MNSSVENRTERLHKHWHWSLHGIPQQIINTIQSQYYNTNPLF